jgi:hypothetical protein
VGPFPDEIRRFIDAHIESIDQLEILRVLGDNPAQEFRPAALAAEVQADPAVVAAHLTAMHGRGLLVATVRGGEMMARYGPANPALAEQVGRLLQHYKERPVSMIKLVYERQKDPLRNFADAFRLRPPEGK